MDCRLSLSYNVYAEGHGFEYIESHYLPIMSWGRLMDSSKYCVKENKYDQNLSKKYNKKEDRSRY